MNRPHIRRHAAEPSPWLLDLNGIYGTAPNDSMVARLAWLRYALSAETSAMSNRFAVDETSAGNSGESLLDELVTRIEVMIFVVVPTIACAFTQPCTFFSRPYL